MPIYTYQCEDCSKTFEVLASLGEAAPTVGPECEGASCRLRKRLSPVVGRIAGRATDEGPAAEAAPAPRAAAAPHVCAKYCEHHGK